MNKREDALRVFVAAATAATSRAWAELIRRERDMTVCGAAPADARLASAVAADEPPDVVVIEADGAGHVDVVAQLRARLPGEAILMVGDASASDDAARLFRAGVRGFVLAGEPRANLITAIRAVAAGGAYLSDVVSNRLLLGTIGLTAAPTDTPLARLSDREQSVFRMLGDGMSVREIA